jgi:hypothetical protein
MTLGIIGCAALQPTDANGPASNVPPYPIALADTSARVEEASLAWSQLSQRYGLREKTEANLQPYAVTLDLPASSSTPILLPKVGSETPPTEEETRESLRRFIVEWQHLIGADPSTLSLVERTDDASGGKVARYEQRPFRYPLRGGFGNLIIRFRTDRRLLGLSSNCIPNVDRLQAALAGLTPKVTWEEAANHIKGRTITVSDAVGRQQSVTIPTNTVAKVRQLVVYVKRPQDQSKGPEVHLAWEIEVGNGPIKTIYLDAIDDQVIAGS